MRKIRLDPDNLEVESFRTVAGAPAARGTVHARETEYAACTGGSSMHTACLDCYSQAQGCTAFEGCHTVIETCFPCG